MAQDHGVKGPRIIREVSIAFAGQAARAEVQAAIEENLVVACFDEVHRT